MAESRDDSFNLFQADLDYGSVLESIAQYAIFLVTDDRRFASWNRGVKEIFGYESDEFVGRSGDLLFVPEDVESGVPDIEIAQARETGAAIDDRWHLRKDGSRIWVNGMLMRISDVDGVRRGYIKIMRENTAQKEAEDALLHARSELEARVQERTAELSRALEELRRNERLFATVFRAGPFAAALLGGQKDCFLEVNEAFTRLTGYSPEEITVAADGGESDVETRTAELAASLWGQSKGPGGFRNREMKLATRSGEELVVVSSGVRIPMDGSGRRLVMFFDITDRKRDEDDLRQAIQDVMQDANWFSRSVVERLTEMRGGTVDASRMGELTRRERQVLEQLARGRSNAEIAADLGIAPQTVRNYITGVYEKIGVKSRVEAVVWARERGIGI